jgi:flavin reductase (DIM6/NTAB) family NADH-FMN oxidoreductase RutF
VPSVLVKPPGIKEAKIRLECVYETHLAFENTDLIIGRVVGFHIDDDLLQNGKIDVLKLNPVARLAGSRYTTLGKIIHVPKEK